MIVLFVTGLFYYLIKLKFNNFRTSGQTFHGNASGNAKWANTITFVGSQNRNSVSTRIENEAKLSDENKSLVERHVRNILRKRQLLLLFMVFKKKNKNFIF